MAKAILNIEGMSCDHCVAAVDGALKSVEGVSDVQVSLEANNATVEYDEAVATTEKMVFAVEFQGYTATVA
ncbi:MAG: cation transporter [Eubacteriaceae bacterium]|nr:cation transporter [Eubacteriaceae bacterium]